MKRILLTALLLLLAVAALSSCTKDYTDDDVKSYIRNEMHLASFRILSGPVEVKGEDGYTDREWTVSTDEFGLGEDLIFHVYDDVYYSLEWTSNSLVNDLHYQKQLRILEGARVPEGLRTDEYTDSSGRPWNLIFVYPLSGREDFRKAAAAISDLLSSFPGYPSILDTDFGFSLEAWAVDPVTDAGIKGRTYSFSFSKLTSPAELSEDLARQSDRYLMDCIEQGLLDRMDEYTVPERSAVINGQENNTEIRRMDEDAAAYPGYAYNYYYDIPYGTLFRILDQEGFAPAGTWKAFSFEGKDGEMHSFSYGEGKNVVSVEEINTLTGLALDDGAPMQEVVADRGMLRLFHEDADTFAAELLALDGSCFREVRVADGEVRIRGKGREFSRLIKHIDKRLGSLSDELRAYDGWYTFVFDNLNRVCQGIKVRFGPEVPIASCRRIVDEAVALTAFKQVLSEGKVYDWELEVTFARWKDQKDEEILVFRLPEEEIDYEGVYKGL